MAPKRSSTIRCEFLGWDAPALPEAARRLHERYQANDTLNLGGVIVVVPGQRAGRRLQELLAFVAEDNRLRFTPPQVVTEGRLPEMLYTPKLPFASDLVQDMVWAQSLRELPAAKRRHLAPHPPADHEQVRWLELGKILRKLHTELAADGLNFTDVLHRAPKLSDFNESVRWSTLAELQNRYHALLDQQMLWDIQTARLEAIKRREIVTEYDIILLGTVDLNDSLRQMLDPIAAQVTAYIVASAERADWFDAHGCLIPAAWCEAHVPLRDEQLRQVDGAEDQAEAVSDWLATVSESCRTDEVVIGVPEEALVPQLQRQLEQCRVAARWVEGARLAETGPYRLLAAAVEFAGTHRYEDLAALIRHPDVEQWLSHCRMSTANPAGRTINNPASLPAQLDRYFNRHLPSIVRAGPAIPNDANWPDLLPAVERIEHWLAAASSSHPLRDWGTIFRNLLGEVYGNRILELEKSKTDEVLYRTLSKILKECDRLGEVPEKLDTASFTAADAFHVALGPLGAEFLPPPADPDAVEILGWLELPLDDAPALIVTSFNEGYVPKSAGADPFLPDRLRRELNLLHNERRYARDAYAASVLCHSRRDLCVLFARRDTNKDPLHPSRLLFACPDQQMVARARTYFSAPTTAVAPRRMLLAPEDEICERSLFEVPRPDTVPPKLERISVTRFKAYLACPYRYYLRHVRKLEAIDDAARELDGGAFGSLLHRVLGAFGRAPNEVRASDRAQTIFEFAADRLSAEANLTFGSEKHRPAIRLQIEQARQRLGAFAKCQAQLGRDGWRIVYAEQDENDTVQVKFDVDEDAVELIGRIDRIDFHEASKRYRILDYKTADRAQNPEKTHRQHDDWIDLQLPLYAHLWQGIDLKRPTECSLELGYFNLPKQLDQSEVLIANWDADTLKTAQAKAVEVIRRLRSADGFWPPVYRPIPDYSEDLAAICLDSTMSGPALGNDEDGGRHDACILPA